ncbi:MAG: LytTR family DNA-binding domain-containing protein [Arcicella sp.]|nr:LytTR family DNA-binding domain-containing protein [Arcicella sp.]
MKTYQCNHKTDRLLLNKRTKSYIPISIIILLKGQANYTIFVLSDGREKVVPHTLKYFEEYLSSFGFQRVHRASMINPKYVEEYAMELGILTMNNGMQIKVSRRRKDNCQIEKQKIFLN